MYTLESTVCIKKLRNFARMLIIIISKSSLKQGHVRAETWSLGQILDKLFVHSRWRSLDTKFMKMCQNVNFY